MIMMKTRRLPTKSHQAKARKIVVKIQTRKMMLLHYQFSTVSSYFYHCIYYSTDLFIIVETKFV